MGNLKTITYPNETIAEYTYDALNRLTYLENRTSDGTVISSYAYTLDDAGNRTKVVEHTGKVVEYEYDDVYKLTTETIKEPGKPEDHIISYTYDKVGNRKTKIENGFTTTYTYNDNNQLVTEDDITYSYDDNGNLKEKNSAEEQIVYEYDAENHLTRVETTRFSVTITVEYEYDAEGNRVRKVLDGTIVTNYLVDANRDYAQVLEERDGNGNLLVRYVYGHDLISQTRSGATSYYHFDGLGSTRALSASSEAVTDTYNYDAFGNLLDKTGTTTNDYLYTGEFFDANIGFYYLRARYMSPAIGRFITMDSFAGRNREPYSLHKYLYAHANPVNLVDPSGEAVTYNELVITGAIIGALNGIYLYRMHFDDPSASFGERALGYATWASGGALIGGLLAHGAWYLWFYTPMAMTAAATSGVWNLGPGPRGFAIEDMLGGNLPRNFPTIDKFRDGIATSIKSINLHDITYQNVGKIRSLAQGYINKVATFQGRTWAGAVVKRVEIIGRALELAVPPGATPEQQAVLEELVEYGGQQGVEVIIHVIH